MEDDRDVPDLAGSIARADQEQQRRSHSNGIGGVAGLIYSWRLYIAMVGALMLVVLLIISQLE